MLLPCTLSVEILFNCLSLLDFLSTADLDAHISALQGLRSICVPIPFQLLACKDIWKQSGDTQRLLSKLNNCNQGEHCGEGGSPSCYLSVLKRLLCCLSFYGKQKPCLAGWLETGWHRHPHPLSAEILARSVCSTCSYPPATQVISKVHGSCTILSFNRMTANSSSEYFSRKIATSQ